MFEVVPVSWSVVEGVVGRAAAWFGRGDLFLDALDDQGIAESQTAKRFGTGEYQVMIVAEKFQTGFDQPLFHTM